MTSRCFLVAVVSVSVFLVGCAGNLRVKIDPSNPVYQPKKDFEANYNFFITPDERKVGYTVEMFPALPEPIRSFDRINTLDEFRRFEKHFWDIRDTDPNTPQNEYKELIDSRFQDIKNEIFALDSDIPGTRFGANGGLKGDLARVYLLWGAPPPHYKAKLPEGRSLTALMAWYYPDYQGKHLMRFLFYETSGKLQLFKDQFVGTFEELLNPSFSPLRKLSNRPVVSTVEEMWEIWQELEFNDPEWIFRRPMFEFSDYTHMDKDTRWTIDKALQPPEPAALTARRFKPTILGQPTTPEGTKMFKSGYHSFMPAYIRSNVACDNPTFLMTIILNKNIDWEKTDEGYAAHFNLRISFQNKKTRRLTEFSTWLKRNLTESEFEKRDESGDLLGSTVVLPVNYPNFEGEKPTSVTLGDLLKQLESGDYIVNIYLQHTSTKKYNSWREEIVINH